MSQPKAICSCLSSADGRFLKETYLKNVSTMSNPRRFPEASTSISEAYAEKEGVPAEVERLKAQFKGMTLRANAKVTSDRVFSMIVHPERSKTLIFAGDKQGLLGM